MVATLLMGACNMDELLDSPKIGFGRPKMLHNFSYGAFGEGGGGQHFGFVGRWGGLNGNDSGVGFWHRWYFAENGRWVNRDPIGIRGGLNTYTYVANIPVLDVDPDGLKKKRNFGNPNRLSYEKIRELVRLNNRSGLTDEMIICLASIESGFNSNEISPDPKSTACGLMQMTGTACKEKQVGADYYRMHEPSYNVSNATNYLKERIRRGGRY